MDNFAIKSYYWFMSASSGPVILKLGGSLVVPKEIDIRYLKAFRENPSILKSNFLSRPNIVLDSGIDGPDN